MIAARRTALAHADLTLNRSCASAHIAVGRRPTDAVPAVLENICAAKINRGYHMIDAEVLRLRGLRDTALRARAIATVLEFSSANRGSARRTETLRASAAACWRIARVVTGRLRAHPYLSYQRGPSQLRGTYHRFSAKVLAAVARYQGRSLQTLSQELRSVVRELDDARALTWSAELSDTFGRSQLQIRQLIEELDAGARHELGYHESAARDEVPAIARPRAPRAHEGDTAHANWPYLAI
jgi:hypothetical protein